MAYEFPVVKIGYISIEDKNYFTYLDSNTILFMTHKYGMPTWWTLNLLTVFSVLRDKNMIDIDNYILAEWIESFVSIVAEDSYSQTLYKLYRDSYTAKDLNTLLHTFPFSKEFIYKLLDTATKNERPDLTIVIEKFIEEQELYEDDVNERFVL